MNCFKENPLESAIFGACVFILILLCTLFYFVGSANQKILRMHGYELSLVEAAVTDMGIISNAKHQLSLDPMKITRAKTPAGYAWENIKQEEQ